MLGGDVSHRFALEDDEAVRFDELRREDLRQRHREVRRRRNLNGGGHRSAAARRRLGHRRRGHGHVHHGHAFLQSGVNGRKRIQGHDQQQRKN